MNNKKRNQLIGILTLLLVALLLAPYIITDKSNNGESSISLLPTNYEVESSNPLIENTDDVTIDDAVFTATDDTNRDEPANSQQTPSPIEHQKIPNDTQSVSKNYVVQLVALSNQHKIEELVALLRLNNYDVYTDPKVPQKGKVTRLFVGYFPTKEQAEIMIIDLQHLTKLKGIVITK